MSALPVNSPIQRLDFDILWCIVKINADMFEDYGALETTLATSRVCHSWRSFMLSTTSIWAHLFDLDHGLWRTARGRRELIRRSGKALLWMKTNKYSPCTRDVLTVIGKQWGRIQKLEVTIRYGSGRLAQWSVLLRPAPHLESFDIIYTWDCGKENHIFTSLFGGSAPMLRELRFSGHRHTFSTAPSSWLRQLCSMDLSVELTVSEMLKVLMSTNNLVNLRLDLTRVGHTTSTCSLVSLPKLAHLNVNFAAALTPHTLALLDHIYIPPTCSLTFAAQSIDLWEIDKKITSTPIIRTLSAYAQSHFVDHTPQKLWLTIVVGSFILKTASHPDGPTFEFSVDFSLEQMIPTHTLTTLLREFSLPGLSDVTWCGIRITGVKRPIPVFTTFMTCLPSVKTIATDKYSLRHLRAWSLRKDADTGPRIGFPVLKTLKLLSFHSPALAADGVRDPVSKFVKARIMRGHAIGVIDFTEETLDVLPNMALLRKAVGLKVRWRQRGVGEIREYICSTAPPQKVNKWVTPNSQITGSGRAS
ncbi:hypothetical protein HYPSUDRAFT_44336 [Hypholoma sublateritium FD-334 SS-4]|uniref:F-box domain-containing protein n=1 Tax=Hypholoma sublateritium (strain FD-334 SS-4) TaxID=945553 RepID=A0A0D2M823_HYPSF|nr:hypothetical protein HYPSUDRAFT_44336 [Hypholoma sublateritium FD-334 SS-4]